MAGTVKAANAAWEALLHAQVALTRRFTDDDIWGEFSIREYDVLYTVAKHPDGIRLSKLNRSVLLSQPALSRLVDRLTERGLLERKPAPGDGRGVVVCMTDEGRSVQKTLGRRHAREVDDALAGLTADELETLRELCERIAAPN
ncbi:MarR family transcriptional regulator [Rhodococcus sp. HNM0569]|uniref:MarR family winged helix-turn-helix transcriptional regulator n=1 Tax=Rhodococcus sp. HNM0569 TaxID=2716340 RepID=UPI00146E3D38|nr:MarR family transcriptional regulator [Rhodococcus sp. HNM0569]NLU83645.1 MarR family transcriptional regulator [Rhodococcus sp. HNM0569]